MNRYFRHILILFFLSVYLVAFSKNLKFNITINAEKIRARIDDRIIKNMESYIHTFFNQTTWAKEGTFRFPIAGNLVLVLENADNNIFSGSLIVQAERPIFNTSYASTLFSFKDNDVRFQFDLNQISGFNENTFLSTNDPLRMNFPAILAFYAYMILGYYYNSLAIYEGSYYFNKAFQIASNAGSNAILAAGWKAFTSNTNRFGLVKEMVSDNSKNIYRASYAFFRKVLDNLYNSKENAIKGLVETLNELKGISSENASSLQVYLFMNAHKEEMLNVINYVEEKKRKKEILRLLHSIN